MLVGRGGEKLVIDRLLSGARLGHSAALVLTGEAGIGKSSLLDHAMHGADGMRLLLAVGTEAESTVAFAGLHQLLNPVLDHLPALPPTQRETLEVALALRTGRPGERFAVGAAALGLLSRVADDGPLLLVVDDAHLWDRSSLQAVTFVGRRLLADRIALLMAGRRVAPDPFAGTGLPRTEVVGLSLEASQELLARREGGPVAGELAAWLHHSCGGNPLALIELTDDVESLRRLSPEAPVPVPDAVRDEFGRRVSALPAAVAEALLLAAVTDGDLSLVARALPMGTEIDLQAAEDAQLVTLSAGRARFRHPLTRAGVYSVASARDRRRAHRAVAEALPPQDLERRAWHLSEAVVGLDETVAGLMRTVGERAMARGATEVAATAFERAALMSADGRGALLLAAGEAAWLSGQPERAADLLDGARSESVGDEVRASIDGLRGVISLGAGSLETARMLLVSAASVLSARDPDTATMLLSDAVEACFQLADAPAATALTAEIDRLVPRCTSDHARIRGELSAGVAEILAGHQGADRVRRAVLAMLAQPGWADDRRRPSWMVVGPLFLRESDIGEDLVRHALDELREDCALPALPELLWHTSRVAATGAQWDEAVTGYSEGVELARETGRTSYLALCLAGLAWLQARRGEEAAARRLVEECRRVADDHDLHLARFWSELALGDLELAAGRPDIALEHLVRVQRQLDERGFADVDLSPGPEVVEALCRTGRRVEAAGVARRYADRAVAKGQPWACARAKRALGLVEEGNYREQFESALVLHALSPDHFEEARTRLTYGAVLRRGKQRVAAREQLRPALATFERLGARPWADTTAAELAATGERPHRRGADELDELTPQELQIVRLLGAGSTTREAATALFLSPKTVEYHLRHVYTKLGINTRADLAARLGGG